jgi:hypothetical protein
MLDTLSLCFRLILSLCFRFTSKIQYVGLTIPEAGSYSR